MVDDSGSTDTSDTTRNSRAAGGRMNDDDGRANSSGAAATDDSAKVLRERIHRVFWGTCRRGAVGIFRDVPNTWNGRTKEARFYRSERELFAERHLSPVYWGLGVAAVVFLTFRISGSRWYNASLGNSRSSTVPTAVDNRTRYAEIQKKGQRLLQNQQSHRFEESTIARGGEGSSSLLATDALIGVMCGCSAFLLLWGRDGPSKLRNDLVRAPLLPGKSLVYQRVCPDLLRTYRNEFLNSGPTPASSAKVLLDPIDLLMTRGNQNNDPGADGKKQPTDDDAVIRTMDALLKNCRIRSRYVQQRQQQHSLTRGAGSTSSSRADAATVAPDTDVVVPYPGLKGVSNE